VSTARATTTNNTLQSGYWSCDVTALEHAIGMLAATRPLTNDCRVSFFEVAGDTDLHVNVTHRHETVAVKGWSGPASMPDGFVHNRRFQDRQSILPHIRAMVFAERL
jgi:hypothetical protein